MASMRMRTNCNYWECSKENCEKKCSRCKYAYYCSPDHQKLDWKLHRGVCNLQAIKSEPWSINTLIEAVMQDLVPTDPTVMADYGFNNCKTEKEMGWLLGLYQGLIKIKECDVFKLHEACMAGKLEEFIRNVYEKKGHSYYYRWFLQRPELVKNRYPLTTGTTAAAEIATPKSEEQ